MPRQLRLEGPALEPLIEQARREHGSGVRVVSAQRVRTGGFAGFFSREHVEVTVSVPDPAPGPEAPGGIDALLAAADSADALERVDRRPGRSLSTETRAFDEVLAALRADLLGGTGTADAEPEELPAALALADATASAGARAWSPTAVVPVETTVAPSAVEPPALELPAEPAPGGTAVVPEPPVVVPEPPVVLEPPVVVEPPRLQVRTSGDLPAPVRAATSAEDLAALAVAVGAPPRLAALAAADVADAGCARADLRVPLLAAGLGSRLAAHTVPLHAGPGEVVLVTGPAAHVRAAADAVAACLGRARTARWEDTTTLRELPRLREQARRAVAPLVLSVPDADDELVGRLAPDLVIGVVDATVHARPAALAGPAAGVQPDVVALVGAARSGAPATDRGAPVSLLDGVPATEGAWTGTLLDALRWAAGT